ncbi:MAG: hypothetical protein L3K19_03380 [Thermoplasmata archaeon]|nr:hypothetical protein [Thermoplasmata archaeon]
MAVRLLLAPITSLSGDTTSFALADLSFLHNGSPYANGILYEPPLASFLQAPLVALLELLDPSQATVVFYPALLPASSILGPAFVTPWLPSPGLLLALKLPLILADVGSALAIVVLLNRAGYRRNSSLAAAAFFLNPVAIWVSSVQAQPDGLAACGVLLFLVALAWGQPLGAGMFLSAAIFSKAYPLALLPVAVAFWLAYREPGDLGIAQPLKRLTRFLGGLVVTGALFLPYLSFFGGVVGGPVSPLNYGGITILSIYNVQMAPLYGFTAWWRAHVPGLFALHTLEAVAVISILFVALATFLALRGRAPLSRSELTTLLATAALLSTAAILLAYPTPQAENASALLPLAALFLPIWRRSMPVLYGVLSATIFGLYMTLFTPEGAFLPVLLWLGPGAVGGFVGTARAFVAGKYLWVPPYFWFGFGLIGGLAVIGILARAWWSILPARVREGVRRHVRRAVGAR